jgi:hypothetical protein
MSEHSLIDLFEIDEKASKNLTWFCENGDYLVNHYNNEYVAIDDENVIEHHPDADEHHRLLERNENHSNSTIIQFITDKNVKMTKK